MINRERIAISLLLAFATFVFLFMMLQVSMYDKYNPIEPFFKPSVEVDPIELTPEQLESMTADDPNTEIKNAGRNLNDDRQKSTENWSENQQSGDPEQRARDFEKQCYSETSGEAQREKIIKEREDDNKNKSKDTKIDKDHKGSNSDGGNTQFSGKTMVEFSLSGRSPFENNMWHIRNPGYTCGYGASGTVVVKIVVDRSGRVSSAHCDNSKSVSANECMIEQALNYAKKSKFNYSSKSPENQSGFIKYQFVSQN